MMTSMAENAMNKIVELTVERNQLRQRIAELEAATGDGWTYTADELPQDGEYVIASFPGFFGVVTCKYTDGWYRSNNIPVPGLPYAWKPLPQPAPVRTAATVEEPTP